MSDRGVRIIWERESEKEKGRKRKEASQHTLTYHPSLPRPCAPESYLLHVVSLHRLSRGRIALVSLEVVFESVECIASHDCRGEPLPLFFREHRWQEIICLGLDGIWRVCKGKKCSVVSFKKVASYAFMLYLRVSCIFIHYRITCSNFLFAKSSNVVKHWIILSLWAPWLFCIALFCLKEDRSGSGNTSAMVLCIGQRVIYPNRLILSGI